MLANRLKQIRASKVVQTHAALAQLSGWQAGSNGAIQRHFEFSDFHHASNFMLRYTDYCQTTNMVPQWSNVYNKVTVELRNAEFGGVTTKEVAAGAFLNMVATQDLHRDVEEVLSLP